VTLNGELGAGKTTFCQGAGEALNVPPGEVKSPTFSLAHKHRGAVNFSHLDLFRLKDNDVGEFLEAGLDEYLAGLCFVEWAERLPGDFWPEERLELGFFSLKSGGRLLKGRGVTLGTQAIWSQVTGKFKLMECSHANHPEIRR
jgi:tRNA threonylcarbamoyladenosine biosynthesis protein TsaE